MLVHTCVHARTHKCRLYYRQIIRWCSPYSVPERLVFIGGLVLMIVGMVIWLPLGPDKPPVQMTGDTFRTSSLLIIT